MISLLKALLEAISLSACLQHSLIILICFNKWNLLAAWDAGWIHAQAIQMGWLETAIISLDAASMAPRRQLTALQRC